MTSQPHLCLGTAQFGLSYGITNSGGQVSETEVAHILRNAEKSGVCWLDTAQAYGNAEEVLGRQLPKGHLYRFISKLPAQASPEFVLHDVESWESAFVSSCRRLGCSRLDSFLLHQPSDLFKPGGHILEEWLLSLRQRGLVQRLGVSIYAAADLEGVNPHLLDLVQLPLSLYDQRLLMDGTVSRLKAVGTAIHARSLYLQGLLLKPADQWPAWVAEPVRGHHRRLEALADARGCHLLDLALGFAREQTDLEAVVLGLCSLAELNQLSEAWSGSLLWRKCEWRTWALQEPGILDPRFWPR